MKSKTHGGARAGAGRRPPQNRIMKSLIASILLSLPACAIDAERIADAIYRVEGGSKAKVPYGILSIPVKNEAHARRICINTVRNNHRRWIAAGKPGDYLDFLADRYCPPSVDPKGNRNWKRNIKKLTKN